MIEFSVPVGSELHINENVAIRIVRVRGGQVDVGITAPRDIPITRDDACRPVVPGNGSAPLQPYMAAR